MQTAVAEVAVGQAGEAVLGHQGVEVAQIVTQHGRWHRGVLPTRVRGQPCGAAAGQPGAVGPDPPQRGGLAGVGDHQRLQCVAVVAERLGPGDGVGGIVTGHFDEQPGRPTRQRRNRLRPKPFPHDIDDARINALAGDRVVGEHPRGRIAGRGDVGIAEHHQ